MGEIVKSWKILKRSIRKHISISGHINVISCIVISCNYEIGMYFMLMYLLNLISNIQRELICFTDVTIAADLTM